MNVPHCPFVAVMLLLLIVATGFFNPPTGSWGPGVYSRLQMDQKKSTALVAFLIMIFGFLLGDRDVDARAWFSTVSLAFLLVLCCDAGFFPPKSQLSIMHFVIILAYLLLMSGMFLACLLFSVG